MGSWDEVLKRMKVVYPAFKPPIWDFEINNGKLFVQTFKRKENKGAWKLNTILIE
jgi:hypothetical protein